MKLASFVCVLAVLSFAAAAPSHRFKRAQTTQLYAEAPVQTTQLYTADVAVNVDTVYTHLNEIIRKLLDHVKIWTKTYNDDIAKLDKAYADQQAQVEAADKKKAAAKGVLDDAQDKFNAADGVYQGEVGKLDQLGRDNAVAKDNLKNLYDAGISAKEAEIQMIIRIRCMMSTWNKDTKYQCPPDGEDLTPLVEKEKAQWAAKFGEHTDTCAITSWLHSLDTAGDSVCDAADSGVPTAVNKLYVHKFSVSNPGQLSLIEGADCCTANGFGLSDVSDGLDFTPEKWVSPEGNGCPAGKVMTGLKRGDSNHFIDGIVLAKCAGSSTMKSFSECKWMPKPTEMTFQYVDKLQSEVARVGCPDGFFFHAFRLTAPIATATCADLEAQCCRY